MHRINFTWIGWLAFASCFVLCCGCSNGNSAISGRVTRTGGQPLAKARVVARCEATGCSANAISDAEGSFRLARGDGFTDGEYTVVISEWRGADEDNPLPATIAAKYLSPRSSGIRFQVPDQLGKLLEIVLEPAKP